MNIKKLTFVIILISFTAIGCRQQDDIMTETDKTNLEILKRNSQTSSNTSDTINTQYNLQEGDPIPPPRR